VTNSDDAEGTGSAPRDPDAHNPYGPQPGFGQQDPYSQQPDYGPQQPPHGQQQGYGQQQPPYGQQPGYGAPYPPGYGYPPVQNHPSAQTSMVLGLVGVIGFFFCVITVLLSPFAWAMGAKARREIDASNGALGGRDKATVGFVTGIIGTALLALALLAVIGLVVFLVTGDPTTTMY